MYLAKGLIRVDYSFFLACLKTLALDLFSPRTGNNIIKSYIYKKHFIKSGERSSGLIPAIPQTTIINKLSFNNVYWKKVDQQVISVNPLTPEVTPPP